MFKKLIAWFKALLTKIEKDLGMATDALSAQVDSTVATESALIAKFHSVVQELTALRTQVPQLQGQITDLTTAHATLTTQLNDATTAKAASDKAAADAESLLTSLTGKLKSSADALTTALGTV